MSGLLDLRRLDLSQCDLITDDGLIFLGELDLLEELSLGNKSCGMAIRFSIKSHASSIRVVPSHLRLWPENHIRTAESLNCTEDSAIGTVRDH